MKTNVVVNSTAGTVKYRLKDVNANVATPIFLDYSYGRNKRIKFSTGYKVHPKYWDKNKERIRAVSTITNRETINNDLLTFTTEFMKALLDLDEEQKQDPYTLKSILKLIMRGEETNKDQIITFFEYADNYVKRRENQSINISSVNLSPITIRSYKQTVNRLKDFQKTKNYNVDFNTIDLNFYYKLVEYFEKNGYRTNTIGKHIKNLKTILNAATEDGFNKNLSYKHREFAVVTEESVSIYLTESEIDALYNADLSRTKDWELARDIFMVGYYTGQRVSDYSVLTKDQIKTFEGVSVIEFNQKKTGKKLFVPLHPKLQEIFELRYEGHPPRKLNAPDINEFIKEAGRIAKINDEILVEKKIDGKLEMKMVPKYSLIMSHTARRSFCTNAYLAKIPVIDIMAISGHSTEPEFYKYIKVTPQERAIKIANSQFFK